MMTKKTLFNAILGFSLLVGAGAAGVFFTSHSGVQAQQGEAEQEGPPPARVVVLEARSQLMAPVVQMPGTVMSPDDSLVAAAVTGSVTWIAEVGADVAQGDVIARIDDRDWLLERADAAADVKRLEARLVFLEQDLKRIEQLASDRHAPQSRLDQAVADLEATRQDLERARNALARADVRVERTAVRAPFPGRVVERRAQVGEFANPGRELLRLVDVRRPEIQVQVPVSLAATLLDNMDVIVHSDQGQTPGTIRTIVPVGDEISRSVELRVRADAGRWLVGTPVRVGLPSASARQVVAVHRDALVLRAGAAYVFVIDEDMTARRVTVQPGTADGQFIEISGDVAVADQVVIRGGERLRPGQSVELRPISETTLASRG